ncbi:MAG: energy-dependent translational throttle protein EttA [Planctomycetes bacterium]|nr:energy-dependent translational throttle protein EttA [Planctomycetota bacterium]
MAEFICTLRNLTKGYDGKVVLDDITLAFYHGAKIGVVGPNGSGKSTLLRIMAQADKEFDGLAKVADNVKIGYVPQEPTLDASLDVRGNIDKAVAPIKALLERFDKLNEKLADPELDADDMQKALDELERVQNEIETKGAWEIDRKVEQAMHALGTPPGDADVTKLSGGEKRRVALCQTLLAQPQLLLLDEPTNHLDADTVQWLEKYLEDYPGTVVAITHDRYFLDHVARWILEMDRGRGYPYEGNYSTYLEAKASRLRDEEKQEAARKRMLKRELEWIRQSPRARMAKSKARVANFEKLKADLDRDEAEGTIQLVIPPGNRLGQDVLRVDGVKKGFEGRTLFSDLSFEIPPGAFVGVIGPNGAGKTTFFRLLVGQEQPDAGTVHIGPTVETCYVDQSREALDATKSVYDEISDGQDEVQLGQRKMNARAYVSLFNFRGPDQQKLMSQLSGGQRNRVQLAKTLKTGGNLLLLDEPTNDLDLTTMQVLEEALGAFPGCVFVISHDRFFLDRLATHILHFDGEGGARFFEGGYTAYREKLLEEGVDIEQTGGTHRRMS